MKQINVTFYVDDQGILAEARGKSLAESIAHSLQSLRDNRLYMEKWEFTEPQKILSQAPQRAYCLCEEFEGTDGIREFQIKATGWDQDKLRELMQAVVRNDEYGLIAKNGISDNEADLFCTEFEDGFVQYSIQEQKILSREEIDLLIAHEMVTLQKMGEKTPLDVQIAGAKQSQVISPGRQTNERQTEQERE